MIKQISTSSTTEVDRLKKEGYVIVAMAHFLPDEAFTYTLERGSEWSRLLGSRQLLLDGTWGVFTAHPRFSRAVLDVKAKQIVGGAME